MNAIAISTNALYQENVQRSGTSQHVNSLEPAAGLASATNPTGSGQDVLSAAGDRTSLSTVASATQAALQTDDVRHHRVAALQAAIAGGTYHVPAAAIADRLITASATSESW